MDLLLSYLFIFIFGATVGWIIEVVFRSVRNGKLINPGFMTGCSLPIYGFGAVIMSILCNININISDAEWVNVACILVAATVIMTIIEFISGYIALVHYQCRLWDYTNRWANYKGIVCPLFSVLWGVICGFFYFYVNPWLYTAAVNVSESSAGILLIGLYYGVFMVDMVDSFNLMDKIRVYASNIKAVINFEQMKIKANDSVHNVIPRLKYFSTFKVRAGMHKYLTELRNKIEEEVKNNYEKM